MKSFDEWFKDRIDMSDGMVVLDKEAYEAIVEVSFREGFGCGKKTAKEHFERRVRNLLDACSVS